MKRFLSLLVAFFMAALLLSPRPIERFSCSEPITITCGRIIITQKEVQSLPTMPFIGIQIFVLSMPVAILLLRLALFQIGSVRTQLKFRKQMPRSSLAFK